jgi:hypothetical protein
MIKYDLDIDYATDEEYQAAFLSLFDLKEYDEEIVRKGLSEIYQSIKDVPEFKKKMTDAAVLFMSEDPEIGLCVLFSYDHFKEFYQELKTTK